MCVSDRYIRALAIAILGVVLSACSAVPGQRMIVPSSIDVSGGQYSSEPRQQITVPITDINLDEIQKLQDAAKGDLSQQVQTMLNTARSEPPAYAVGKGDVLQITVWDHPELVAALGQPNPSSRPSDAAPGFLVDDEGNVQFPYAGSVHVAGLTVKEIQARIASLIAKIYKDPQVTVRVASFRWAQIYIDGEVRAPGLQQINDIPMTLPEAIGRAGGFTPNADQSRVDLIRDDQTIRINIPDLIDAGRNPARIMLQRGDMLRVAARDENGIYVMGEVNRPATILPMRSGKLTLAEALSQAGSLNQNTAEANQLFVIRAPYGSAGKPQIFHLDATSPVSMILANQFDLHPKDVVFVDNGALVKFNRVLNLLLPAINAGLTAAIVTK
ncbi:capsular polysaccharide transporter [Paraburkholderia sp. PGU19]|uniref:polysaccharide biosynthesis/export family protein n=1 Tax=Paraburkholderia sp. PGU19 TaxID=2735434 RepID=UPI0015DBF7B2|nr:polysaccharide biosynthesis/export family protein [Paraburkholderia sp. PGU19]BCF98236.1 capsular polysaccharide transporter [Paraburkholderia sp. PGU19]